jgi:hypothetical protein
VLNNVDNQQHLDNQFNIEQVVTQFIRIDDIDLKLRALLALTLFAYNNLDKQCILKQTNCIVYDAFRPFIDSNKAQYVAMACFQVDFNIYY